MVVGSLPFWFLTCSVSTGSQSHKHLQPSVESVVLRVRALVSETPWLYSSTCGTDGSLSEQTGTLTISTGWRENSAHDRGGAGEETISHNVAAAWHSQRGAVGVGSDPGQTRVVTSAGTSLVRAVSRSQSQSVSQSVTVWHSVTDWTIRLSLPVDTLWSSPTNPLSHRNKTWLLWPSCDIKPTSGLTNPLTKAVIIHTACWLISY